MSSKCYPDNSPLHYGISNGEKSLRPTFRGCAVGILTHEDIQTLEIIMDNIDSEEYSSWLYELVTASKERMQQLHDVLGAFDIGNDGHPTKPESERIDWVKIDSDRANNGGAA